MVLKVVRGVWFLSALGAMAALLIVYASLPPEVIVIQEGVEYTSISKEAFFYIALIFITLVNSLVYVMRSLFEREEAFRAWFHGLIITLNIFFVVSFFSLNALNGTERFDFQRIGFLIYGSVILVAAWALLWPISAIFRKIFPKQLV